MPKFRHMQNELIWALLKICPIESGKFVLLIEKLIRNIE